MKKISLNETLEHCHELAEKGIDIETPFDLFHNRLADNPPPHELREALSWLIKAQDCGWGMGTMNVGATIDMIKEKIK